MAFQELAFYYYHGAREALIVNVTASTGEEVLFDGRQGEIFVFPDDFTGLGGVATIQITRPDTPAADAVDHLIFSSHNFNGTKINALTNPTAVDLIDPDPVVTVANGVPLVVPFTTTQAVQPDHEQILVNIIQNTAPGSLVPELGEIFLTTKHTMSRGPDPGWDHPWVRSQQQFTNVAGVTSTWLNGTARKRFVFTWHSLGDADRQILFDLQDQTDDWSQPFWIAPPDDIYGEVLFMQLERDGAWKQDGDNPLGNGTTDEVTLPLIEVLG